MNRSRAAGIGNSGPRNSLKLPTASRLADSVPIGRRNARANFDPSTLAGRTSDHLLGKQVIAITGLRA
jgi:hypothetical protein